MQVPLIGPVITKKHYTEMNLLSDEKNNFMFGHVLYDHGHDEDIQIILKVLGKTFWTFRNRTTDFLTCLRKRRNSLKK